MAENKRNRDTEQSPQEAINRSYDYDNSKLYVEPVDTDGTSMLRQISKLTAKKITVSGSDTYVATAPIGTDQASAAWQAKKISVSGGDTVITWADSDASFDNVATDLTALTYG